jgi:hypothetical protein
MRHERDGGTEANIPIRVFHSGQRDVEIHRQAVILKMVGVDLPRAGLPNIQEHEVRNFVGSESEFADVDALGNERIVDCFHLLFRCHASSRYLVLCVPSPLWDRFNLAIY